MTQAAPARHAMKLRMTDERIESLEADFGYARMTSVHFGDMRSVIADRADLIAANAKLVADAKALADKVDATSDCDHKRASCEDVGCIGAEVKRLRTTLAECEVTP